MTVAPAAPTGGVSRMSRRVMNLAHLVTQNARRHGDRPGLIWGDKSWTWREIDACVSALAAALAARGIGKAQGRQLTCQGPARHAHPRTLANRAPVRAS